MSEGEGNANGKLLQTASSRQTARAIQTRRPHAENMGASVNWWRGIGGTELMKPASGEDALTADDLECLWAIAKRATIQDRLVLSRGKHLEEQGLIELTHEWPTLTAKGVGMLKDMSAQAVLDLHKEPGADN